MQSDPREPRIVPELLVSNFSRSLSFYREVLGFAELYGRHEEGFSKLDLNGAQIMIEERSESHERDWVLGELAHPYGRGLNLEIDVDDVDAIHRNCQMAAARIFLPLEEKWYRGDDVFLGVRQFIVVDPDGYLLRFSQFLGSRTGVGEEAHD